MNLPMAPCLWLIIISILFIADLYITCFSFLLQLVAHAIKLQTRDNVTAVIIDLRHF